MAARRTDTGPGDGGLGAEEVGRREPGSEPNNCLNKPRINATHKVGNIRHNPPPSVLDMTPSHQVIMKAGVLNFFLSSRLIKANMSLRALPFHGKFLSDLALRGQRTSICALVA